VSRRAAPFTLSLLGALVVATPSAHAEPPSEAKSQAETLFLSAKTLRAAGKYPEACAAFAESRQLEPGIGISLYLADCYEHVGKPASAWAAFRDAETRARARNDKRAEVAHARAAAIEPKLGHIGIALSAPSVAPGADVKVDDGEPVPASTWTALPADPGDHVVKLRGTGKVVRAAVVHVVQGRWAIVRLDPPQITSASATLSSAPAADSSAGADPSLKVDTRQAVGYSLLVAGVIGTGVGAALLVAKNQSQSTGAPNGPAVVNQSDAIGSDVAFALGGAAFASAVILYLTAPTQKDTAALTVAPVPLAGGAGAFLSARF
jgi:hypothetical protein